MSVVHSEGVDAGDDAGGDARGDARGEARGEAGGDARVTLVSLLITMSLTSHQPSVNISYDPLALAAVTVSGLLAGNRRG